MIRYISLLLMLALSGCGAYHPAQPRVHAEHAKVAKGQIEYYRFGKGSPIVLIPGYATDVSSWNRDFLNTLADKHNVIVINNRNVGGSTVRSSQYESNDLANDVYQVIQDLQLQKPAVLGISMGGMIAQQVAASHPGSVGQLILINTAIAGHQSVHPDPKIEKAMLNLPQNKFGFYAIAVNSFFPTQWRLRMAYSLAADRFLPRDHHEIDFAEVIAQQKHVVLMWADDDVTAKKLKKLQVKTLILNGEADIIIPPVNSEILAKSIPHAKLVRWKDGGHAMIYQYPLEIGREINAFLSDVTLLSVPRNYHPA